MKSKKGKNKCKWWNLLKERKKSRREANFNAIGFHWGSNCGEMPIKIEIKSKFELNGWGNFENARN